MKNKDLSFGEALIVLEAGYRVAREGWNGKDMFLLMNGGYSVAAEDCRPDNHINEDFLKSRGCPELIIQNHIDMWTAQNTLCVGWLASQMDMIANDWVIVDDHVFIDGDNVSKEENQTSNEIKHGIPQGEL